MQEVKFTALMLAAEGGQTDCVRLLLDSGADKEAKNIVRGITVWESLQKNSNRLE